MTTKTPAEDGTETAPEAPTFTAEQQRELDLWHVPPKLYRYYQTTWHGLTEAGIGVGLENITRGVTFTFSAKVLGQSVDRIGHSWVESLESVEAQLSRWGTQKLAEGPAPAGMKPFIVGSTEWAIRKRKALDGLAVYPVGTVERRQHAAQIEDYFGGPDPRNTTGTTVHYDRWTPEDSR